MNQQDIMVKLSDFTGTIGKKVQRLIRKRRSEDFDASTLQSGFDEEGKDNFVDDLPLTINREEGPGITFYSTENAEISRHAKKSEARGIDSFGEKDTYSFEEADDYQTERDRHQNSDLSERFYTGGLEKHDLNR